MTSGRQTLASIDRSLREEQAKLEAVQRRAIDLSSELVALQQQEARDYHELARLRVEAMAASVGMTRVDDAEARVHDLLEARDKAAEAIAEELHTVEATRRQLMQAREAQADALDQAAATVDTAETKTQARLEADPDYRAQRERAREAERTALHAEDKAARSEREQDEKGQSYRDDPLFTYLWQRRYGTADYRANPLFRWLDGKVAKLISYTDASVNFARLQAIPERLREHANRVRKQAETEFETLRNLEMKAREADGIPALESAQAQEQGEVDAIDARLEALTVQYRRLLQRRERFAAGEDDHYRLAVAYLASELGREDLQELRHEALATPFPEDDVIIARLLDAGQQQQQLASTLTQLKALTRQHHQQLRNLESLRAEYKRRHYDRPDSNFADGAMIGMLLGEAINGMLDRDSLWRVLDQQRRPRPSRSNPNFGSGGFGRGSPWSGGGGWGGFGGGGFKTGGGF